VYSLNYDSFKQMGRKNLARPSIFWYYPSRCERDSRSRQTTAQQSKIKKKLYKDIHKQ